MSRSNWTQQLEPLRRLAAFGPRLSRVGTGRAAAGRKQACGALSTHSKWNCMQARVGHLASTPVTRLNVSTISIGDRSSSYTAKSWPAYFSGSLNIAATARHDRTC